MLRLVVETEAGQDTGSTRFGGMRADIGKSRLDVSDAMRIGRRFGFREGSGAFLVGLQHNLR